MPSTSGEASSSSATGSAPLASGGSGDVESRLPRTEAPGTSSGASAAPSGSASAGAGGPGGGEALAKQATCTNCHAVDTKKVGPSFKDLSKKFKGADPDKVVADMKAKPVHQGALKTAKEDDVKSIVRWIQSL